MTLNRPGTTHASWATRTHLAALLPLAAVMVVLFTVPIARTLARSVLEPSIGLANFYKVLGDPLAQQVFWTTLRITVAVTVMSALLAYPVASFAARCSPIARNIIFALVLVPFWTSLLVRVYGWTFILQRTGPLNELLLAIGAVPRPLKLLYTEAAVVLGITHYMLPFMIFSLYVAYKSIDPRLTSVAAVLGARPLRTFFTITLPLTAPGLIAGSVLVFIGSLGFYVTPAMLGGPSEMMIANLITFQVKESLDWPIASTLAAVLVFAVAVLGWIYFAFLERSPARQTASP